VGTTKASWRMLLGLSSALVLAGCSSDGKDDATGYTETRRVLESWNAVSPLLGFSLDAALPDELYTADLVWNERSDDVKFSPSGTRTRLTWCLAVDDDTRIEEVDVRCEGADAQTNTTRCDDRIEATLLLRLRSEDGALDDDLRVTYTALSTESASFSAPELAFAAFEGDFVITSTGPDGEVLHLGAFGSIDLRQASGSLLAEWETSAASETPGAVYTVANWASARTPGDAGVPHCSDF
jgi:hypothetical protein